MEIPKQCTVLIVGGGPAGSYAASALAREGIDTVLLEADNFPRYHIGESMLPSIRHFFRLIDLDKDFDAHGFRVKKGGSFKLSHDKPVAYTDFVGGGGPENYAYNIVRSEADHLMFKHAIKQGAKCFDGVKVESLEFLPSGLPKGELPDPVGRPVSAIWTRKSDKVQGTIRFQYLVDASGRAGLMSTKYLQNRRMNQSPQLSNVATWGYWSGAATYGVGTVGEGGPYFSHLPDATGWIWFIPLHNGTTSVGVVRNKDALTAAKRASGLDSRALYLQTLDETDGIRELLAGATCVSEQVKSGSDWSYSAPEYASPYVRLVGDAGCFVDPFFSSGVHMALTGGLAAAVTICASIRGHCDEGAAALWHSKKVAEAYTRFLIVVVSALRQITAKEEPVIADIDERSFDRAFEHFRPVIQGNVDVKGKLNRAEVAETMEFCASTFKIEEADRNTMNQKMVELGLDKWTELSEEEAAAGLSKLVSHLTPDQVRIVNGLAAYTRVGPENTLGLDQFNGDAIDGLRPILIRGELGLTDAPLMKNQEQLLEQADETTPHSMGADKMLLASLASNLVAV